MTAKAAVSLTSGTPMPGTGRFFALARTKNEHIIEPDSIGAYLWFF
jgi:hypothetical protein